MADEETKTNRSNKSSTRSGGEHEDKDHLNAPRLESVNRNEDDIEHRQQLNERKKLFV